MKSAVLAVLAIALLASLPVLSREGEQPVGPVVPAAKDGPMTGPTHEVWEVRFLLLEPTTDPARGIDLEIDHVLGTRASPDGERQIGKKDHGRFLTVGPGHSPETLVENLGKLGPVQVVDRANLAILPRQRAKYHRGIRIPVPQVESRSQKGEANTFVRMKFEQVGTKLSLTPRDDGMEATLETSFLLGVTEPYGYPLIATANWSTQVALEAGETAVFRCHFALPGALLRFDATGAARGVVVPGASKKVTAPPADFGRVLVVLLTRSHLP